MTVAVLLENTTAREIGEWAAYFAMEQRERDEQAGKQPRRVGKAGAGKLLRSWFGHRVVKKGSRDG